MLSTVPPLSISSNSNPHYVTTLRYHTTLRDTKKQGYFAQLFNAADVSDAGRIGGSSAVTFLTKSGLPLPSLKQIWSISDSAGTHSLGRPEFCTALRFIQILQANPQEQVSVQTLMGYKDR